MRVLATGGAGYVGSATVRRMIEQGHEVTVYDNLSTGYRAAVPGDCLVEGDLEDQEKLAGVLRERRIEIVVHFAGSISVSESMEKPEFYYRNNVANSLKLLEVMQANEVKHIIFSSTAGVYAPVTEGVLTEEAELGPANPYAFSKFAIERMIEDFATGYGWDYAILRYFNASGASEDGQYGEAHHPETHLIPLVLQVALGQRDKINIYGEDYDTPDGTCVRDYVHVDDLAEGHILVLDGVRQGGKFIYNIGTGVGHSVLEVVRAAEAVIGGSIATEITGRREGDTSRLVAGADRIQKDLGWQPRYTQLQEIIATAWRWHKTHPHGYVEAESR